ncbi:iron chaperone [Pseudooceanicola sp. C21-150M6]|uniref:iron chaperone n=1 Tax=Pseudooceanicola sp. C21-150M6 TaxID=3434355 RepID=UPI003D7F94BD
MSLPREIEAYLSAQPQPQQDLLRALHDQIAGRIAARQIMVQPVISYRMPGFRITQGPGAGKMLIGYAGWARHIGLYPHSGKVIDRIGPLAEGLARSSGALSLPLNTACPDALIDRLIDLRCEEFAT